MDLSMKDMIYERVEWIKEKGYWLLIAILIAATFFLIALFSSAFLLFLLQPEEYRSETYPEFQTKEHDGYKLVAILQNSFLKSQFCSIESFSNTGKSINQQQFCNFNYQLLPTMHNSFDVTLLGLNSLEVRYAKVCLLKFPRSTSPRNTQLNDSESMESFALTRNRYVCQKYRAYNRLHIINKMQTNELIFMEIELQLTEKGFSSLEFLDLRLEFEQERSKAFKLLVDHYIWISGVISFGIAGWTGVITFVLGLGIIIKLILSQKQQKQEQMLASRLEKKKRR